MAVVWNSGHVELLKSLLDQLDQMAGDHCTSDQLTAVIKLSSPFQRPRGQPSSLRDQAKKYKSQA
ncbi:hypothetical protein AB0L82_32375 [Nocardia sp. NPDC052001]|uniref:hypothetical protein n=1 Tax=Nocardia sp. NPDC052001 TaxID=3154853 RepID=UPI003440315B